MTDGNGSVQASVIVLKECVRSILPLISALGVHCRPTSLRWPSSSNHASGLLVYSVIIKILVIWIHSFESLGMLTGLLLRVLVLPLLTDTLAILMLAPVLSMSLRVNLRCATRH